MGLQLDILQMNVERAKEIQFQHTFLEILFLQVKGNEKIEGIKISSHEFLLSAFADYATYLVRNMDSVEELFRLHNEFEQFSSLKANWEKNYYLGYRFPERGKRGILWM